MHCLDLPNLWLCFNYTVYNFFWLLSALNMAAYEGSNQCVADAKTNMVKVFSSDQLWLTDEQPGLETHNSLSPFKLFPLCRGN